MQPTENCPVSLSPEIEETMNLRQVQQWYGAPGSRAVSQRSTDMALIGASEENLLMTASLIARGQSVALTSGRIGHRILPHPSNTTVTHQEFYRALAIAQPTVSEAQVWNDRGDKLFILGWQQESLECFFKALSLDESCAGAWVNLSYLVRREGPRLRSTLRHGPGEPWRDCICPGRPRWYNRTLRPCS